MELNTQKQTNEKMQKIPQDTIYNWTWVGGASRAPGRSLHRALGRGKRIISDVEHVSAAYKTGSLPSEPQLGIIHIPDSKHLHGRFFIQTANSGLNKKGGAERAGHYCLYWIEFKYQGSTRKWLQQKVSLFPGVSCTFSAARWHYVG